MPIDPSHLSAFAVFVNNLIHRVVKSLTERAFRVGKFYHFDFSVGVASYVVGGRNGFDIIFLGGLGGVIIFYGKIIGVAASSISFVIEIKRSRYQRSGDNYRHWH